MLFFCKARQLGALGLCELRGGRSMLVRCRRSTRADSYRASSAARTRLRASLDTMGARQALRQTQLAAETFMLQGACRWRAWIFTAMWSIRPGGA